MFDFVKRSGLMLIVSGVIAILFGLIAIFSPIGTIFALVMLWGIYAVIDAILAFVAAAQPTSKKARPWLITLGILGLIAGVLVIFRPISSTIVFAWVLGIWLIIRGVVEIISAFNTSTNGSRFMLGISGVFFILAGILFIINPGGAALGVAVFLGVLALGWGIFQVIGGIRIRREAKQAEEA
ncbi:HdeD family acid-resistance protein [Corynebacterium sp. L4756]|uniref:HdeD family acid-resistance protein n=1 Tax=unclassified Corynebacterium TaxID=2624378 RepID=UPI00374DE2A6